jgi:hypothetical protein
MSMRIVLILMSGLLVCGCASQRQAPAPTTQAVPSYEPSGASALIFEPTSPAGPRIDLARRDRQPGAFGGYETLISTYFYLRVDDRQRSDGDRYERRNITETVGVRVR